MVIELIISAIAAAARALAGFFPQSTGTIPVDAITAGAVNVGTYASVYGNWVPISDALLAFALIVGVLAVGFTIKVVRIVASFLTAGGGSAA